MIEIRFDCEDIEVHANTDGSLSVIAKTPTLVDSEGLLRALAAHYGIKDVRRLLDVEIAELKSSDIKDG